LGGQGLKKWEITKNIEIDNYAEIARLKELQVVQKIMEKFDNNR